MKYFLVIIIGAFVSSCANTIKIPVGVSRLAEVGGDETTSVEIGMSYRSLRNIFLALDSEKGDQTVNSRDDFVDTRSPLLTFGLNTSRIAVFYDSGDYGLQYQFLGTPAEKAEKGNFAFSAHVSYRSDALTSTTIDLARRGTTMNGKMNVQTYSAALLTSYRFSPDAGFGLTLFQKHHASKGSGIISSIDSSLTDTFKDYGAEIMLFAVLATTQLKFGYTYTQVTDPIKVRTHLLQSGSFSFLWSL